MAERQRPESVRLQVAGAQPQDVGKATARLTRGALQTLGMHEGDVIEIIGKRATAAIALPPYPEDEGLSVIRMDGLQRANAAVGMGDYAEVRRAEVRPARRVVLAPAPKNLRLTGSGEALRRTLYQRPLVAGGVTSTSVYRRTPTIERGPSPELPLRQPGGHLVAPLGTPLIVGPAVLTTLLTLTRSQGYALTLLAFSCNLVLVWVALRWASAVVRAIGAAGAQALAKVFGLLLAAIGVTLIRRGLELTLRGARSNGAKDNGPCLRRHLKRTTSTPQRCDGHWLAAISISG